MRTTLDIDDDVLQAVKELARRGDGSAGKVISELARRGLAVSSTKLRKSPGSRGGVPLLPARGEIVTLEHVQNLMDIEGV